jgi:hypothetical protein
MKICEKEVEKSPFTYNQKRLPMRGNKSSSTCSHISCTLLLEDVLELLQGNDSNPLNEKTFVHKAWLDMIKFKAPTH